MRNLTGRFTNASEVLRAGLRLLEEEENRLIALKNAIQDGLDSGRAENFDAGEYLKFLKANKKRMIRYHLTNKAIEVFI